MMSVALRPNATTAEAPVAGSATCPKCGGRMWDNRASKRNPKAPDFKCRDRRCDGVLWPGKHNVARPIVERRSPVEGRGPAQAPTPEHTKRAEHDAGDAGAEPRRSLRACYLDVTDFVLADVRPRYEAVGVRCTDATVAAIVATLFIGLCKERAR